MRGSVQGCVELGKFVKETREFKDTRREVLTITDHTK